jgi:OmpA-OmpF porin, OOP family
MNIKPLVLLVFFAPLFSLAQAQTEKVLTERGVTESALIEALTPAAAMPETASGGPIRTRSIRVIRDNDSRLLPTKPAKPASASLLITFEPNSAELTPMAKQSLDVVGQALTSSKLADFRFVIQGHADPTGQSDANLKLSQLRAESVRQYLVRSKKIDDSRLEAVGKGDKEPLNTSDPTSPENRRVTIVNLAQ